MRQAKRPAVPVEAERSPLLPTTRYILSKVTGPARVSQKDLDEARAHPERVAAEAKRIGEDARRAVEKRSKQR